MFALAKAQAAQQARSKWIFVDGSDQCKADADKFIDELDKSARRIKTDHVKKHGGNHPTLGDLSPEHAFEIQNTVNDALRESDRLAESRVASMKQALKDLKESLVSEHPPRLMTSAEFDQKHKSENYNYNEKQILLSAIHKDQRRDNEKTIDALFNKQKAAVVRKQQEQAFQEIVSMVSDREKKFISQPIKY